MHGFFLRTAVHFDENALSRLGQLEYKKVCIFADPFTVSSGLIKHATKHLDAAGIQYKIFSDITPDPSINKVAEGVAALMVEKAPCLIAIGGGSAIDLAKSVRLFAKKMYPDHFPYFIAIPTTSGTGSEVTSFAVVTDTDKGIKHALVDNDLLPDEAILDVEMVKSVPASITADTGMDVLTHAIEAYVSTGANTFADLYAARSIFLCLEYLVESYKFEKTGNVKAREQMHIASNLAGIAFNAVGLGINHGMAHQLGAQLHIPHGRANAILLPHIIEYNAGLTYTNHIDKDSTALKRYAHIARKFGVGNYNNIVSVETFVAHIRKMQRDMNVPCRVSAACPKLTREEYMKKIPSMVEAALKDRCTPTNPRVPKAEELAKIFEKIW